MKRNPSIELFRCLCMFGVCLLHALDQGNFAGPHRGLDNLMTPSVVGFLFISGWFGLRLSAKHILKLLSIGVYCAVVVTGLYDFGVLGVRDFLGLLRAFESNMAGAWFLWCYLALILVAPALEPLFENGLTVDGKKKTLVRVVPLFVLVFGWSYAASKIPILKEHLPCVGGFGGFGVLTFVGIYIAARVCRLFELDCRLKTRTLVVAMLLSGVVCWLGFMHYHSPFAVVFAGSLFLLFARLPMGNSLFSRVVLWLSPSMFSVYIMHSSSMGMAWLRHFETEMIGNRGHNYYLVCFFVASVCFVVPIVLDLPRRAFKVEQVKG